MGGQFSKVTESKIYSVIMNSKSALVTGNYSELSACSIFLEKLADTFPTSQPRMTINDSMKMKDQLAGLLQLIHAALNGVRDAQVEILQIKKNASGLVTYCENGTLNTEPGKEY